MRAFALLLAVSSLMACQSFTDPMGVQDALEDAQQRYTDFVRWGELGRAARFLVPEEREAFLDHVAELEHIRVTDFDVEDLEYDGEEEVRLTVTYHGFSLRTAVETRFREHQHWIRNEDTQAGWEVKTDLPTALATVGAGS